MKVVNDSTVYYCRIRNIFVNEMLLLRICIGRIHISTKCFSSHSKSLAFELIGSATRPKSIVFVHGVMGSKKNFRTAMRAFLKDNADFKCISIDIRGHGDSHGINGENTIAQCGKDILSLVEKNIIDTPTILCAHSLGGKVALKYIEESIELGIAFPLQTWILDSLPSPYPTNDDINDKNSAAVVIKTIKQLPKTFPNRQWIVNELQNLGISKPVSLWLGTSVIDDIDSKQSSWAFDINVIQSLYDDFCQLDLWHTLEHFPPDHTIHYVRAGKVSNWTPEILHRFSSLPQNVKLHLMPNVGHWIHSEDLPGLLKLINDYSLRR